jgi:surface protein
MEYSFSYWPGTGFTATDTPDLRNVTSMKEMFANEDAEGIFNGDISSWDVSNVTDMSGMFTGSLFNQDISSWDVSKVTNMSYMFTATPFNQDISGWDVSSELTDMSVMFYKSQFNQDISGWDVSNVTDMNYMFYACPFNQDISGWDVSKVTNMSRMFYYCRFNQDLSGWDVSSVTDMGLMFTNSQLSSQNYDKTLIGWASLPNLQSGVQLGADSITYCLGEEARNILTSAPFNWVITDGGKLCHLIINEVYAAVNGDANGDGTIGENDDQFIEIYNATDNLMDISGYYIKNGIGDATVHLFPANTLLRAGEAVVVFGGGTPTNIPGKSQVASTGSLAMQNSASEIIYLYNDADVLITTVNLVVLGGESLARNPDFTGDYLPHSQIQNNSTFFSPSKLNESGAAIMQTLGVNTNILGSVRVYINKNTLKMEGLKKGNTTIKLYNILGKQVMASSFDANSTVKDISLPKLGAGVYIVQLENAGGKLNKKFILE